MATPADLALADLGGEPMARDPDRRVSIAPQTSRSLSDSTAELPPPVTVLPAVRRSRIVSPAPPRTPRPEKSSTTVDFIATLNEVEWIEEPVGGRARFVRRVAREHRQVLDRVAREALEQLKELFTAEGLVVKAR